MKLKTCYYKENLSKPYFGLGWYLPGENTPACKCIMAVAEGKNIGMPELNELLTRRTITPEEYNAIRNFDNRDGTVDDLRIILELAKKVKVKLVRRLSRTI